MTFNQSLCPDLSSLVRASIGWKIDGVYKEQIAGKPGFWIDTTDTKRFFPWATSTKKNQLSQVKKFLKTENKLGALKTMDTSRSGTHYFAKVFTD